ncbi:hypothetical protein C8T65DRAFT_587315 [Cerioporus squamosus]|nr:hypothetical protein C8T65DRAFT_587315 [Cerioporus squamosus]
MQSVPASPPKKRKRNTPAAAVRASMHAQLEDTVLRLPSDFDDKVLRHPAMSQAVKYKRQLREGFARDALDAVRVHITTHATLEDRRKQGSGMTYNTSMDKRLDKKKQAMESAAQRYNAIRTILLVLGMSPDNKEFQPLLRKDMKAFAIITEEQILGDSARRPSWIWGDFSFIGKETNGDIKMFMLKSLRVHWFRYSALVTRWSEEVDTEREEMFHTTKAYRHDMEVWKKRAEERKAAGLLGSAAYARR